MWEKLAMIFPHNAENLAMIFLHNAEKLASVCSTFLRTKNGGKSKLKVLHNDYSQA